LFDESFSTFPFREAQTKVSPQSARCVIPSIDFRLTEHAVGGLAVYHGGWCVDLAVRPLNDVVGPHSFMVA
jgi:hypothetical protein